MNSLFRLFIIVIIINSTLSTIAQNSMVGDGFGGRLWYKPTNYTVGSYSGYSICYSGACNTGTNQLYGWGDNSYQQLGYSYSVMMGCTTPTPIPGMTDVKYYSTGYNMGVIKNNGTGWVWGAGLYLAPTQVISNVKFLDGAMDNVSFVKNDGTVWSIGHNSGNFGDGTVGSSSFLPIQMQGVTNAVRVANGYQTNYVLLSDGTVKAVGANSTFYSSGLLGIGNTVITQTLFPVIIPSLSNIVDIKATTFATAVLDSLGDVYVWGDGKSIGDGDSSIEYSPKKIIALSHIVAISGCADGDHFLALDENKNCYAWGPNSGQFGVSFSSGTIFTPTLVATNVIDIMAGETFSYLVKADGSLWCSGSSNGGSIWLNLADAYRDTFTVLTPSLLPGTCSVNGSAAISSSTCKSIGVISINNFGGQLPYHYNIGNGNQTSNVFFGLSAGIYTIVITDNANCINTVTCAVNTDTNAAIANFSASNTSSIIPLGSSLVLTNVSINSTSIKWEFCNSASSINNTVTFPTNNIGNCCVKLIAKNNTCKDSVTKCFNVEEPFFISIPNVFTPNGDGKNDVFKVSARGVTTFNCSIYNRWGLKLYEWNDANGFWNGKTPDGSLASDGTYFYIINYDDIENNSKTEKGFLTLFRD